MPPVLPRQLLVQLEALVPPRQVAQLGAEDHVVGVACRMQHDHVSHRAAVEAAQHAHDRRDAAACADEQQLVGQLLGQHEVALDAAQADDAARPAVAHEVRGDGPRVNCLDSDRDPAVLALGLARERVGAPVADALDVDTDPQVLPGLVAGPLVAGPDQHGRGVVGLAADLLDPAAQLARRPERVDQLQVVVREQGRTQSGNRFQQRPPHLGDVRLGPPFRHAGGM
jgi:hypothetical protein